MRRGGAGLSFGCIENGRLSVSVAAEDADACTIGLHFVFGGPLVEIDYVAWCREGTAPRRPPLADARHGTVGRLRYFLMLLSNRSRRARCSLVWTGAVEKYLFSESGVSALRSMEKRPGRNLASSGLGESCTLAIL